MSTLNPTLCASTPNPPKDSGDQAQTGSTEIVYLVQGLEFTVYGLGFTIYGLRVRGEG